MVELFDELSAEVKQAITNVIDLLIQHYSPQNCINVINELIDTTENEDEKEFIRFYFSLQMERLNNENSTD